MKIEIEKKYEVDNFPRHLVPFEEKIVWQAYILSNKNEEIRIRKQLYNEKYICDVSYKKGQKQYIRKEYKINITKDIYDEMVLDHKEIIKERKFYIENGVQIMVDYYPQLKSYYAEIEFESESDLEKFNKPSWLGNEVNINNKELINLLN